MSDIIKHPILNSMKENGEEMIGDHLVLVGRLDNEEEAKFRAMDDRPDQSRAVVQLGADCLLI
jgi:hypothetical protein